MSAVRGHAEGAIMGRSEKWYAGELPFRKKRKP
jgi:hypothetical protein